MQSHGNKYFWLFGLKKKITTSEEKQEVKGNEIDHTTNFLFMLK